jgi:hypothetical protein
MIELAAMPLTGAAIAPDAPISSKSDAWPGLRHANSRRYLTMLISLAVLAASLRELATIDLARIRVMLPDSPGFWLLFAASYLAPIFADWLIFRRLWRLPLRGMGALIRKTVSNEVLLGYSGELYLYAWARRHVRMKGTPFGTIKDVAILSAAAGNIVTLLLLAPVWPMIAHHAGLAPRVLILSIIVVTVGPILALTLGDRLFTLRRDELALVSIIHLLRIAVTMVLLAAVWHYLMPAAPLRWWLLLAALRQFVSRLPFVPNKDIVFAGAAAAMLGSQAQVTEVLALGAGLVLTTHLLLGTGLFLLELIRPNADFAASGASPGVVVA